MRPAFACCLALLAVVGTAEEAPLENPPLDAVAAEDAGPETADSVDDAPELTARGRYNLGLAHLEAGDHEAAATEFLAARDQAGPDPELRYRAAFNLALALAVGVGFGDAGEGTIPETPPVESDQEPPPGEVIETLRQSAAWFNDAVRLAPPGDDDARINLELVSKWILQLADALNEGDKLEARLDRLIDDQRGVRDDVRRLLAEIADEGATAEPVGFDGEFHALAVRERMLMAEVGDCVDLAAEERLYIEQTPEEQRSPEQQGRAYQLSMLNGYLERARQSLSDSRRRLRRLEGERAHRRVDAALAELKRAREQLLDPVTVLQAVARDERELMVHTGALAAFDGGSIRLDGTAAPTWLTDRHLAERQADIGARTGEILGRFEAVAASDESAASGDPAQRTLAAAKKAVPTLDEGLAAMRAAISALETGDAASALPEEGRALDAVTEAIELFADVKTLIELSYGTQQGIVGLLTPGEGPAEDADLGPEDRIGAVSDLVADNRRRMEQLEALLDDEARRVSEEQEEEARQANEQRYEVAETLRQQVVSGLYELSAEVERGAADASRAQANRTLADLDELRRLFFSIVEHLAALLADQGDTHDETATLQASSSAAMGEEFAPAIGAVAQRQAGHAQFSDALAAALAQQADAAGSPPVDAQQAEPLVDPEASERLAKAGDEVRQASGRMTGAATMLADAAKRATTMSPEMEPALEDQRAAMEHLENALAELAPPEQRQQQGDQQQQGEPSEAKPRPSEDDAMSQRQALKRLQAIRDREAERQRNRAGAGQPEPVEKDW